ncbi:ABATE domain-containing protein [Streptomyces sp. 35G-GA-8]|uniref:CGNR zinc finger domain-containing protein n=1 Tax=Streptomyces sp. 35G-GA-8 TaxID=2939434 RepID=UPI00201EB8E1|nr:CGNR zinc finger domain-containing protein [Streptomyces sp. 35G-GA-8]MCL7376382.1 CGNR zinc finger domain-containing protein [Streptomyces sp. 35G-GA-8]
MSQPATDRTGMLLQPPGGGRPYRFDTGALCLELLTTGGPGMYARHEVLHDPAALLEWVRRSRLAPGLEGVLSVRQEDVGGARTVRDALLRLTLARAHGGALAAADLAVINTAAAEPPLVTRIAPDGTRAWAPGATGPGLLSTVARDAVELLTGPFAARVRECAAHNCYLLFVDTSRPGRRRWCAMERCGTREKVRAHRTRGDTA